jgi:hypothetical protein
LTINRRSRFGCLVTLSRYVPLLLNRIVSVQFCLTHPIWLEWLFGHLFKISNWWTNVSLLHDHSRWLLRTSLSFVSPQYFHQSLSVFWA